MLLNNNSLIMQWNRDENGNPISWHIPSETQQISPTHGVIQLVQVPDQHYRMKIVTENNIQLTEVFNIQDIAEDSYYVDYGVGIVRFHKSQHGKMVMVSYYGRGVILISDSRIFHRDGENVTDTWENILNRSQDALDLIESAGGLVEAMEKIDEKVSKGEATADRLENFITETQFYGYTINLSREAFVVKAKENGEVSKTELPTVYTDVVVYQGAKQIIPTLSIEQEQGCTFKIEGQRVRLATIDINVIKAGAILNIDCGDGLIAQRTLEVTKVFDGVSQYAVEMTNPFYSFEADSAGSIEKEVTVACDIKVTKANVDYTNYTISVQNAPIGLRYNIGATGVEFTGALGGSLPSHGSCLVVVTIDGTSFNKTFTWNKVRKGEDAKSLVLVGGQIIRYETPDYSDIPSPYRSTVTAKTVGLSGSPKWYVKINETWVLLEGQSGTELTFPHNDTTIWGNRKETTVKCSLEGYEDELTLVKLATGTTGADAITVVLTNESHTLAIDNSGQVHESEIAKTKTSVLAFQGTKEVTPVLSKGACEGCDISIDGNLVSLASLDNSFSTATAIINVKVGGVTVPKTWTISKAKQGSDGVSGEDGKSYILNITDGTRSFTYSQINLDPRPSTSSTFVGTLYENGVEVLEGVSYYWIANGHLQGSSMNSTFTPTISQTFDESILNNDITLTATYQGNTVVQTIPISITKDANGLDWVQEWDDTKTDVRGNLILTPKLFAGSYDQENDLVTGVAIGKDVLNDGNTIGVAGYQNNKTTFLLDTDGTLMVGNPFEENSTGLYFDGDQFTLKVNQLTIEGSNVATTDDLTTKVDAEINSAKEEIRAEVSDVLMQVDELDSFINSALKDGILDEVERSRIMTLYEALTSEMTDVASQYVSLIGNPYLTNQALLETMEQNFIHYTECYQKLTDILNIIMGNSNDGTESDGTESGGTDNEPEVITDIVLEETPNDEDITVEDNLTAFGNAISDFKEASAMLHKSMSDALTSISEEQANTIVGQAKEEIKKEIDGVSDALGSLETTMNGEFKSGLISTMNLTTLRGKISQLETEKADIDGQYKGIINHSKLGTTSKTNLATAKGELDTAHDQLVIKINSAITDNLMTEAELTEINLLIAQYGQALGKYSEIAQQCNADIALNLAQGAIEALNQEDIFNKLTNNGEMQGLYLQDGKVYVNGEYINSRNLKAVRNDGTETFKIDSEGNVSIKANSFHLIGTDSNVADKEYVDNEIGKVSLGSVNIVLSNEAQVIPTNSKGVPLANQTFAIKVQMYQGAKEITDFAIGTVSGMNGIATSVSQSTKVVMFSVSTGTTIDAVSGKIAIPLIYNDRTYSKDWSWAIAKQGETGATGSAGADAKYVTLAGEQVFKYTNNFSGTPTPSTIKTQATAHNISNPTYVWTFRRAGETSWNPITSATTANQSYFDLAHDNSTIFNSDSVKSVTVRCTVGSVYDETTIVKVSDGATGETGATGSAGADAITITLTNENHAFSADSSGNITSVQSTTTDILAYKGASKTSVTVGALPVVTGLTLSKTDSSVTIQANTGATLADTGTIAIPLTVDGKSFTKNFSWTKVRAGATGSAGASAKSVDILASSQVFKSSDGGKTFAPNTIILTPKLQNLTYSNWQYSVNGGSSWSTVSSGSNGLTISGGALTISKDSPLYSSSVSSISFRVNTNDSGYYDVVTVVKLHDVGELEINTRNLILGSDKVITNNKFIMNTYKPSEFLVKNEEYTVSLCVTPASNVSSFEIRLAATKEQTRIATDGTTNKQILTATFKANYGIFNPETDPAYGNVVVLQNRKTTEQLDSTIHWIQVQKGNVATGWSLAPEDAKQEITDKINEYDKTLNQLAIFNKLTNNGKTQGLYMEDNELYINAEYIQTGTLRADLVKVNTDDNPNLLPIHYTTLRHGIGGVNISVDKRAGDDMPVIQAEIPIFQGGASSNEYTTTVCKAPIVLKPNTKYCFSLDVYGYWGGDDRTTAYEAPEIDTPSDFNCFELILGWRGLDVLNGYCQTLFAMPSFDKGISVGTKNSTKPVRQWTRKMYRFTTGSENYEGYMYIHMKGEEMKTGDWGYIRFGNMMLEEDRGQSTGTNVDYLTQIRTRTLDISSGDYCGTKVMADGLDLREGIVTGRSIVESAYDYTIDYDGIRFTNGGIMDCGHSFMGVGKSRYSYDGGSSGIIEGYDEMFGFGTSTPQHTIEGGLKGVFTGVHWGFQDSENVWGRPDIYTYTGPVSYDGTEWALLGETVEPRGLVRRDDSKNITTNHQLKFLVGGGTDTANVWNQEQYNTTGNGQMLTYSDGRVFVSNPQTPLVLESSVTPSVKIGNDVEHQLFHTGYIPKSGNWWNGGAVRVGGDGVCEVGKYIDFHNSNSTTADYTSRITDNNGTIETSGHFKSNGAIYVSHSRVAVQASHGGLDLGGTDRNTAICSANIPTWWNGANSYTIYTTGNKPSWQDVGAIQAGNWSTNGGQDLRVHGKRALVGTTGGELHLGYGGDFSTIKCGNGYTVYHTGNVNPLPLAHENGYYGMKAWNGWSLTNDWIRTTGNGLIPSASGTGGGRSSLGTSGWRFSDVWSNIVNATSYYNITNSAGTFCWNNSNSDQYRFTTHTASTSAVASSLTSYQPTIKMYNGGGGLHLFPAKDSAGGCVIARGSAWGNYGDVTCNKTYAMSDNRLKRDAKPLDAPSNEVARLRLSDEETTGSVALDIIKKAKAYSYMHTYDDISLNNSFGLMAQDLPVELTKQFAPTENYNPSEQDGEEDFTGTTMRTKKERNAQKEDIAVDIYGVASIAWEGVRVLLERIERLEQELKEIKGL